MIFQPLFLAIQVFHVFITFQCLCQTYQTHYKYVYLLSSYMFILKQFSDVKRDPRIIYDNIMTEGQKNGEFMSLIRKHTDNLAEMVYIYIVSYLKHNLCPDLWKHNSYL